MAKSVDDMCVHTLVQQARKKTHKEITSLGGTVWGAASLRKEKDVLERACQQTSASFTRKHVLDVLKKQRDAGTPLEQWVFPKMHEICQSEAALSDALMGCLQSVSESTHVQHMDDWARHTSRRVYRSLNGHAFRFAQAQDFERVCGELFEAQRLLGEVSSKSHVDVGGDARAVLDPVRHTPQPSFDLAVCDESGTLVRAVEVTTVEKPVSSVHQLFNAVLHGSKKYQRTQGSVSREVSVRMSWWKGEYQDSKGLRKEHTGDGYCTVLKHTSDKGWQPLMKKSLYYDVGRFLTGLSSAQPNLALDVVRLTDHQGHVWATFTLHRSTHTGHNTWLCKQS